MRAFKTTNGEIQARIVKFKGFEEFDFIVNQTPKDKGVYTPENLTYAVTERITCRTIITGCPSEQNAILKARAILRAQGKAGISKAIQYYLFGNGRETARTEFMIELAAIVAALFSTANNHKETRKNETVKNKSANKTL